MLATVVRCGDCAQPVTLEISGAWPLFPHDNCGPGCGCLGHRITSLRSKAQPADDVGMEEPEVYLLTDRPKLGTDHERWIRLARSKAVGSSCHFC